MSHKVNQAQSTTTITDPTNPSGVGQPVTFTATVSPVAPGAGAPSGSVTFKDGTTTLGSPVTLTGGAATFTTSTLAQGSHSITAVYSGDFNFVTSTSAVDTHKVEQASTTTVSDSLNPSVYGQGVTFTATIKPVSGSGTPTGTVTFKDGTTTLGNPVTLSKGTASFTTSTLTTGSHSITAVYSGDSTYAASTSAVDTHVVSQAATTTALSDPTNPSVSGQSVAFTTTIKATAPGAGTPTGTVTFKDNGVALAGSSTVKLANGTASFSITTLAVGSHSITAAYSGDSNFVASTSAVDTHVVNPNTVQWSNRASTFNRLAAGCLCTLCRVVGVVLSHVDK